MLLNDETLRDGLQSPTVQDPSIKDKIRLLHLMDELGIDMADIGLPGAGPRAYADVLALAQEISAAKLNVAPNCAARTTIRDIEPILSVCEKTGTVIEARHFYWIQPDPTIRRALGNRHSASADRRGCHLCRRARLAGDVCHRRHDSGVSRDDQKALPGGHRVRRPTHRPDRHGRTRDSGRGPGPGTLRRQRSHRTVR